MRCVRSPANGLRLAADGDAMVFGDDTELYEAVKNVVENAVRYAPASPVEVRVGREGDERGTRSRRPRARAWRRSTWSTPSTASIAAARTARSTGRALDLPSPSEQSSAWVAPSRLESGADTGTTVTMRFPLEAKGRGVAKVGKNGPASTENRMLEAPTFSRRTDLGLFLRARRGALRPVDVGLEDDSARRHVAGLRREEVAKLAGISTTWYTWIEQAREINFSLDVIDEIGRALLLTAAEIAYLKVLASDTPPQTCALDPHVPDALRKLVELHRAAPAYIATPRLDLLVWNTSSLRCSTITKTAHCSRATCYGACSSIRYDDSSTSIGRRRHAAASRSSQHLRQLSRRSALR